VTRRDQVKAAVEQARANKETTIIDFRVEQEDSVYPMVPAGADLDNMIRRPVPAAEKSAPHNVIFETGEDE
jgi:acetolactate synthase-1/2/3 large subunit